MVTDFRSILARWTNNFSQLLNAHELNDARQTETHTAEPLLPEPSGFEVEMAIEKLKRHRSPGIDQILAELIKAGGSLFALRSINLLLAWNKEELPEDWKDSIFYLFIRRTIKLIVAIIEACHFCQLHTKFIQHPAVKVNSIFRVNSNQGSSVWISMQQVNY